VPGPDYFAGQSVEISGVIAPPGPPLAEGLFDFQAYLATRGIYSPAQNRVHQRLENSRTAFVRAALTDAFLNWSRQTLALGLPDGRRALRLLWAMTLGWRTAFHRRHRRNPF